MSATKHGGPAFPQHPWFVEMMQATVEGSRLPKEQKDEALEAIGEASVGMSLRDYFAAKAMATLLTGAVLPTKEDRDEWLPTLAGVAYETADAMLKARSA